MVNLAVPATDTPNDSRYSLSVSWEVTQSHLTHFYLGWLHLTFYLLHFTDINWLTALTRSQRLSLSCQVSYSVFSQCRSDHSQSPTTLRQWEHNYIKVR